MPVPAPRFDSSRPNTRRLCGSPLQFLGLGLVLVACTLSACTRVPELEDQLSADLRSQPYPTLLPLDSALAQEPLPETESAALAETLDARAANLRRRAEELRRRTP